MMNRWVILAEERAQRPAPKPGPSIALTDCPFCPGNEAETLPEIDALREAGSGTDQPGWRVRVVPNKYPALRPDFDRAPSDPAALAHPPDASDLFVRQPGFGHHEVIIESDRHVRSVTELTAGQLREAFHIYRRRFQALSGVVELESAVLIKNVGLAAGASIEHCHSQLIATPIVPPYNNYNNYNNYVVRISGSSPNSASWRRISSR